MSKSDHTIEFYNGPSGPQYFVQNPNGTPFFSGEDSGAFQKHHVIPTDLLDHADLGDFLTLMKNHGYQHADFTSNGVYLPTTDDDALRLGVAKHSGSHDIYTDFVEKRLLDIKAEFDTSINGGTPPSFAAEVAASRITGLQNWLRSAIVESPEGNPILFINEADPRAGGGAAAHNLFATAEWTLQKIINSNAYMHGAESLSFYPVRFENGSPHSIWNLNTETRAKILVRDLIVNIMGTDADARAAINTALSSDLVTKFADFIENNFDDADTIPYRYQDLLDEGFGRNPSDFSKLVKTSLEKLDEINPLLLSQIDAVLGIDGNSVRLRALLDAAINFFDDESGGLNLQGLKQVDALKAGLAITGVAFATFKVALAVNRYGADSPEFQQWLAQEAVGFLVGIPIAAGVLALSSATPVGLVVMFSLVAVGSYFELREIAELIATAENPAKGL